MIEYEQIDIFGHASGMSKDDIQDHWVGMPDYNNHPQEEPKITATFKFRTEEDFEVFNKLLKEHIYGEKVFDGMQRKHVKSAWFPPNKKGSRYEYAISDLCNKQGQMG